VRARQSTPSTSGPWDGVGHSTSGGAGPFALHTWRVGRVGSSLQVSNLPRLAFAFCVAAVILRPAPGSTRCWLWLPLQHLVVLLKVCMCLEGNQAAVCKCACFQSQR